MGSGATQQEQEEPLPDALGALMPNAGQSACYGRVYDNNHLTNHPNQLVTSMVLALRDTPFHREGSSHRDFDFRLGVTVRGNNELITAGDKCRWSSGGNFIDCTVSCDAETIQLSPANRPGSVLLTFEAISADTGCAGSENGIGLGVRLGNDDKEFRLDPKPLGLCNSLWSHRPMEAGRE